MQICKHFIVTGKVQGVYYRQNTMEKAKSLGLTGWVQNLSDGSVELIACGEADTIKQLESWLWQGPEAANVLDVRATDEPLQNFSDFKVERKK